ncbi:bifunctional diaminohydroxyphosphoribosylaminopyrimidine deaminase/5-amino-6-(5-phosphoribosylamino)uracil reductase RibD [Desulfobulbus alkaliphilus]|uniref:bifunctional diaminohydroxyphosphoribosylaminopyrimidine deaminase/5-amino-6-(5-phosphoribosylamino)uracil reductase RibD n=1 Tax=Desulfobulbus alkaliphilus TaxID=869814 RepID=UPI001965ACB2|nr:bifunctional diaminohydroxyphosphoribosylaminopyrimidine deaminase/5-amino-6-(5-phosphoribosylamino)uracil reductase RibD [Desulfobulbus alkaliphilus]MBM9535746.1 bifunctional diaminohydroxyphosphoribosylaminopyrimidine deaminase/5-amino-6-(5-phosphoribosylamino)uracil reductase RibD [Desulfobulbus alkaliphilus]
MENQDSRYMHLALLEAEKGLGRTSPNPSVGAVIVQQGEVVGRGYHQKAGSPHAEIHAIADAGQRARGGVLYVTLEPCRHRGRTPPCTEAILASGLATVVIGMEDPNPRVRGGGAKFLHQQGIEVRSGVLEEQCRALNHPFIKHSGTGLPWIVMKAGLSLDGRITRRRGQGEPLTGPQAKEYVHRLRNQTDAILIGVDTALIDDPSLTTRLIGSVDTRDPLRVILDGSLRLPPNAHMLRQDSAAQTWVFCSETACREKEAQLNDSGARVVRIPVDMTQRLDLMAVFRFLGENDCTSVLVEGGARVHGAVWGQGLVDELLLLYAPFIIGDLGTPLVEGFHLERRPATTIFSHPTVQTLGDDILVRGLIRPEFRIVC